MAYRVVQWGTGWLGRQAILGILDHPDLDLVGVYVTSDEKHGKDVGELVGIPAIGITATSDVDHIMSLDVDCHVFMLLGAAPETVQPAVERLVSILEAGQNVCQTSLIPLCYPKYAPAGLREPIEAACAKGGSRCYSTGIYPGVINDTVLMAFLACCERVDKVTVTEILNYGEYYDVNFARHMGLGAPLQGAEEALSKALAEHNAKEQMGVGIRNLGERLGLEMDEIRIGDVAVAPAVERVEVEDLLIEPGTVGAYRLSTVGYVKERPVIEFRFVTRYDNAAAPGWPAPRDGGTGCYRIEVEGSLSLQVDINVVGHRHSPEQTRGFPTSSAALGANLIGSSAAINAIPFLCQAKPGLYGSMDLDRTYDLHVLRGV